jgi:hypothetical protein
VKIIANDIPKSARDGYKQITPPGNKMKSNRTFLSVVFVATVCLAFAATSRVHASAEDQVDQAVAVSRNWVGEIDAGKYEDSYSFTCDETRNRFPEDRWVDVLKALRSPWGAMINRQQLSHIYKPNGVPGLEGECMVITYKTAFKNLAPATEVVVLKWEDGKWRGAGYNAGRTSDTGTVAPASNSTTETHTENHWRAQPQ